MRLSRASPTSLWQTFKKQMKKKDWAACMDDEVEVVGSGITPDSGIAAYIAETDIKKNSSPFIWWSANYEKYPILGQLARRNLSAQWALFQAGCDGEMEPEVQP